MSRLARTTLLCAAFASACAPGEPFASALVPEPPCARTSAGQRPAATWPAERAVLVDGVRDGRVWDERDGFRLVSGHGTVALVGPDGHVRASHRFSFADGDVPAVLLSDGHAIVANGGRGAAFVGPYGGELDRWNLDTDTIEALAELGYATPSVEQVGDGAVVLAEGVLTSVGADGATTLDQSADRIGCSSGPTRRCFAGRAGERWRFEPGPDGSFAMVESPGSVPRARRPRAVPRVGPLSSTLGLLGLPSVDLSPTHHRLVVSTAAATTVLGPEGLGEEVAGTGGAYWEREELWTSAGFDHPVGLSVLHRRSVFFDRIPQPLERDVPVPEIVRFDAWQNLATDAENAERPIPPLRLAPVCSRSPPIRCVRAHTQGSLLDGWQLYDPARPRAVLADLPFVTVPPGLGYVLVSPGGNYVRAFVGVVAIMDVRGNELISEIDLWAELDDGWLYVDPDDNRSLRFLSFQGQRTERVFSSAIQALTIVDATHVLVRNDDTGSVIEVPSLSTTRAIPLGEHTERPFYCGTSGRLIAGGVIVDPAGCPIDTIEDEESGRFVRVTRDRRFWLDLRLGDAARVHRASDGAEIVVRVTTRGVLVSGPGGVFEGRGEVLDHVVVREPGPVRSAGITTGGAARARFERPGLVAAFFRGEALPSPGPAAPIASPSASCPDRPPRIDSRCSGSAACHYARVGIACECRPAAPGAPRLWDCAELGE